MTLQAVFSDKADIPAGLEGHYKEDGGKYVLVVEGMKTQADFDNYADALKKRFADAGTDFAKKNNAGLSRDDVLEVVETAFKKFNPGEKSGGNGGGQLSEGDAQRLHDLERNVASLTEQNQQLISERDTATAKSKDTTIRNALTEAATAAGVVPEGIPNLVNLTKHNFEIAESGEVVTKLEAGDGVSPNAKPGDFFSNIANNKQYRMFWPSSKGAGADSGDGSGSGDLSGDNPWSKKGWNMTKQTKLYRSNPAEATRLAKVAGVEIGAAAPVR